MTVAGRPVIAGLSLARTAVMGIVNVTPDSFSDGGNLDRSAAAIDHGVALLAAGADLIDVGGESTRPGAQRVPADEELHRVLPAVRGLAAAGARVSVDTMRAETARRAVAAGAVMINDVSGGLADPAMLDTVAELAVPIVLMHWRGHSDRMDELAHYGDVVAEVCEELGARLAAAVAAGIDRRDIVLDPGLGFAKGAQHNWDLLGQLDELAALGQPLLIGAARKRFLGQLLTDGSGPRPMKERDDATAAVSALAAAAGVWGVRVHDVRPNADAVRVGTAWRSARTVTKVASSDGDRIVLTGITAIGFHGVLPQERLDGQEFVVDVTVHTGSRPARRRDELAAAVDYSQVAAAVHRRIVGTPFQLIESLAEAIAADLLELPRATQVDVCVHKPQAPIAVPFDDVMVRISRTGYRR